MIERIIPFVPAHTWPLHGVAASRSLEQAAASHLSAHTLMDRAGLAVARLALAIAPHARSIWIACGPGNNGGDGLEAAVHLHQWGKPAGKQVIVTWLGTADRCPADSREAFNRFEQAGLSLAPTAPEQFDLAIDALLGIGSTRAPEGLMLEWITRMNAGPAPVLCVDLPTGLHADTGALLVDAAHCVRATHTLSLLTLKPGLFTAHGREQCGDIWFDSLDVNSTAQEPIAWLGAATCQASTPRHAAHKGSFGDVCVIGGDRGMTGAALLAAGAALRSGCGRVYVGLLDACLGVSESQPDLMFRPIEALDLKHSTVVCGCGGGQAVAKVLPRVLSQAARLVLDADALNAVSQDSSLQTLLQHRSARGLPTVLTPHPLEAARLLGTTAQSIQANRLEQAQQLAEKFQCIAVLKGSGTVIAAPGEVPTLNPSGNARLSTAGTGDLLAGMLGGHWSRHADAAQCASISAQAVFRHGQLADTSDETVRTAQDFLNQLS
jgi:hydroxyethylthiazole kinase-like uncharacterized protein yjeF